MQTAPSMRTNMLSAAAKPIVAITAMSIDTITHIRMPTAQRIPMRTTNAATRVTAVVTITSTD